ncbi:MAG: hypothetical protein ACXW3V_05620, partial [Methylocystis sp.]
FDMADSLDTRIAPAIPQSPSRRHMLAAGAAAIGATAVAAPVALGAPPLSNALAQAIERHKATFAAVKAHHGPEDLPLDICDADDAAFMALAETPWAGDAEFAEKMKYMAAHLRRLFGPYSPDPRELLVAIRQHVGEEAQS